MTLTSHKTIDDADGRFWRYGRFSVYRYPDDTGENRSTWNVGWQWCLGKQSAGMFGASVGTGTGQDDEHFSASVCLGRVGSWYFNADHLPPFSWLSKLAGRDFPRDRELSLRFHDGLIAWSLWAATMGYHKGARWRANQWSWHRWIGWYPEHVGWETLDVVRTVVPMPEGSYPATVELKRGTWRRRRLFAWAPKVHHYVSDITPDTPIPEPGKGENPWDCGDDATYSMSGPFTTAAEAVAALVESVYRSRTRYGSGPTWQPSGDLRA